MPLLKIETNVPVDDSQAMTTDCSRTVAEMLGKPERYVMVSLQHNPAMLFDGNDAPLAYLELKSLGLPEDRTADFSATLCALMNKHLGVPADRTYIEFSSPPRHMWGWKSATF